MTPSDRIPVAVIVLVCVLILGWFVGMLWYSEPVDPCEINAPMEASQCRAQGGRAVLHPVIGWGWEGKE